MSNLLQDLRLHSEHNRKSEWPYNLLSAAADEIDRLSLKLHSYEAMKRINNVKISAHEIWTANGEVAVNVDSKCVYRVTFFESEAHILAPGLNITVEIDKEVYPIEEEEFELAAIMLIAQVEGGMEL